ncbi:ICP22 family protein [Rhizobium terrae]|uniref:hypothetical protein n=1 Tax=Rhizobium terrae TaxID=2171756 RepID=UPI001D016602|nr:hypothetical protein [Rhizobium terrae]
MALAGADRSTLTEAPMPGSTKGQSNRCDVSGFADLYKASPTKTIGVIAECPSNPTGVPVRDFDAPILKNPLAIPKTATIGTGGTTNPRAGFSHASNRAPRVDGDEIKNIDQAPTSVQIGDTKPGHNEDARKDGDRQVKNHLKTVLNLRDLVNGYPKREGGRQWGLNNATALKGLKPPSEWDPKSTAKPSAVTFVPSIELRSYGKQVPALAAGATGPAPVIEGRWVISEDPQNDGIYVYYLLPEEKSLKAALTGKDPNTDRFARVQERLKTQVLDPLVQPLPRDPRGVRFENARPRRAPGKGGGKGKGKPAKKPKPPPKPFDLKAWNLARVGDSAQNPGDSFRGIFLRNFPADQQNAMEFRGLAAESLEILAKNNGPNSRKVPNASELVGNFKRIEKFRFWSSREAGAIGMLRRVFGTLFIKAVALGTRVKEWFSAQLEKWEKVKGKGAKNAALRFGGAVIKKIGLELLDRTTDAVYDCLSSGLRRTFDRLVDDTKTSIDELFDLTGKMEEFVQTAEAEIEKKINQLFGDYQTVVKTVVDLLDDAKFVGELVAVAKRAIRAGRLLVCAAGGVETGGLSCAVSLLDEILSWIDLSPSELLIDLILESCDAQQLFAEAFAGAQAVQMLPKQMAAKITGVLRDLLPEWAKDLICTEQEMAAQIQPYDPKDYPCDPPKSGGGGGSSGGGGSGAKGGGAGKGGKGTAGGEGGGASPQGGKGGGGSSKDPKPESKIPESSGGSSAKPPTSKGASSKEGRSPNAGGKPPPEGDAKPPPEDEKDNTRKEDQDESAKSGAGDANLGVSGGEEDGYSGETFRPPESEGEEEGPAEGGEVEDEEKESAEGEVTASKPETAPTSGKSGDLALTLPDERAAAVKPEGGEIPIAEPKPIPPGRENDNVPVETLAVIVGGLPEFGAVDPDTPVPIAMTFFGIRDGQQVPVVTVYGIDARFSYVSEPDATGLVRFRMNTTTPFYIEELDRIIWPKSGEGAEYEGYAAP